MRRFLTPRLALLSFGHFTIDAYSSFLSPLLPLVIHKLHLTFTQVGALVALSSLSSSLSQPLFGWFSDRLRRPWFVAFGPLCSALFLSSVGAAPSFGALIALLMVGGLGAAAYHPQAAVLASTLAERRALAMSFFVSAGTFGFALGPLFAVTTDGLFGLERTWLAAAPGLVISCLLIAWFARVAPVTRPRAGRPTLHELKPHVRPLALLYCSVVFRSAVSIGFMTFLAVFLHQRGFSVGAGGALLTAYLASGAFGGFAGGVLSDRWGGRSVVLASFALSLPLYLGFLLLPTGWGLACLMLGSFAAQSSLPVNVVMGQELSPRHASTISSLLMGAAWGLGALIVGPVGAIADAHGLRAALLGLTALLAGGVIVAWLLPRRAQPLASPSIAPQQVAEGSGVPIATPPGAAR